MMEWACALRTQRTPVGWPLHALVITENFVKLTPLWGNLAETTTAAMPAYVIRRPETVTTTVRESQNPDLVFRKFLELEWVHVEAENDVAAQNVNVRIGRIRFGIPTEIKLQEMRLHCPTSWRRKALCSQLSKNLDITHSPVWERIADTALTDACGKFRR